MRIGQVLILIASVWLAEAQPPAQKPLRALAPSLAELGDGWTTNSIISMLDPRSRSSRTQAKKNPDQSGKKPPGQTGWLRAEYGRGDMIVNRGAYFVSIQRWSSTNALEKAWAGWNARPDRLAWRGAAIGQDCYWTEDAKFHGLAFRRGLFHVVITCGAQTDHSGLVRLAEVIDAKICGKPIPKAEEGPAAPALDE